MLVDDRRDAFGFIEQREYFRVGQKFAKSLQHTLSASHSEQPVMD
jgi:hypothetical protein